MVSVNRSSWRKVASFSTLRDSVYSLVDAHSVADATSLVSNKFSLDTVATFQEDQLAAKIIIGFTLSIQNLEPLAFLISRNKVVKSSDPTNLKSRPDDIAFFRFICVMNSLSVNNRITTAPDLYFQFCMKLPRSIYEVTEDTANLIESLSVSNLPGSTVRSLNGCFSIAGIDTNIRQSTPPPSATSTTNLSSPAMQFCMSSDNNSQHNTKGYYGGMTFLHNQKEFNITFGSSPTILHNDPAGPDFLSTQKV